MPKFKNSNATFWVIFKHCVFIPLLLRNKKLFLVLLYGIIKCAPITNNRGKIQKTSTVVGNKSKSLKRSTLFEIFIFCPKFNFDFPRKLSIFGVKTREIVVVLDFLTVDNFDFTRKIVKKNWVKKL